MRFEKIWIEQCRATRAIKRRFGVKDALDYLVGEKLRTFADAARHDTAFARELPRFLAAIWRVFNEYELTGYVAMQKPACAGSSAHSSTCPDPSEALGSSSPGARILPGSADRGRVSAGSFQARIGNGFLDRCLLEKPLRSV